LLLKDLNNLNTGKNAIDAIYSMRIPFAKALIQLLQMLEDRFAKGATIVTSQPPVNKWYEYINELTLADAICDKLTANAHKIE
jgi:hypothetical protein